MKKKKETVRLVVLDDESRNSKAGNIQLLGGEATLTVTITGAAGSGKTVLAGIIDAATRDSFQWVRSHGGPRWMYDVRILIQTQLPRKEVKSMAKKPPMKEKSGKKKN